MVEQTSLRKYLSAPGILFLIIVTQIPFVVAIYFAFTNWNLLRPGSNQFLGWDRMWRNFTRILNNPDFYTVLWNTIFLTISVVVLTFIFGMALALLLNRPFPGRALARTLLITPFLVMPVAAGVLWKNIVLEPTRGLLTYIMEAFAPVIQVGINILNAIGSVLTPILKPIIALINPVIDLLNTGLFTVVTLFTSLPFIGIEGPAEFAPLAHLSLAESFYLPTSFYLPEAFPMASIILIVTWQWTPFVMLILLSGLQSLPDSTLEAAKIDGAGGFGMFRYIMLPHLKRFIEIALLLETIFILNVFGIIFIVTTGGPSINTTNLPYEIFKEAFSRWNVGRASAYGIFAVILANIVILLFLRVLGNQNESEAPA